MGERGVVIQPETFNNQTSPKMEKTSQTNSKSTKKQVLLQRSSQGHSQEMNSQIRDSHQNVIGGTSYLKNMDRGPIDSSSNGHVRRLVGKNINVNEDDKESHEASLNHNMSSDKQLLEPKQQMLENGSFHFENAQKGFLNSNPDFS